MYNTKRQSGAWAAMVMLSAVLAAQPAGTAAAAGLGGATNGLVLPRSTAPGETNVTVITAKRMSFDYPTRTAVFEENVLVNDPQVQIRADTMKAVFDTNNSPETVTAVGNVHILQLDREAICGHAVYSVRSGLLVLTVKPYILRGGDRLEGSRIIFNRDEDKVYCENGTIRILPGTNSYDKALKP